jgi:hypothetical protein
MRPPKAHRNLLALLAVAILLSGCQQAVNSRLVGTWEMDKAKTLAKKVTSEADATDSDSEPPRMSLQFQSTGVLETVTQLGKIDSVKTGSWKLLQEDSSDKTTIECSIGGLTSQHEVRWVDDSTIRLAPPNMSGQKMILKFVRRE